MSQNSIPDVFEIPDPAAFEIPRPRDGKRMAWLAAFALMAVIAGATLALLDDMPGEAPQVDVAR